MTKPQPAVLPAQDKDAKVTYLTKIINVVAIALGQAVPAKPLKVCVAAEWVAVVKWV